MAKPPSPIVAVSLKQRNPIGKLFDYPITLEMLEDAASYSATIETIRDEDAFVYKVVFRFRSTKDIPGTWHKPAVALYFKREEGKQDNYVFLKHEVKRLDQTKPFECNWISCRESTEEVLGAVAHFIERRWGIVKDAV